MVANSRCRRLPRTGMTVVELLAAIPLIAVIGIVAVMLLFNGQRVLRKVEGQTGRIREMRHAAAALSAVLRNTHSNDLHAWNDTLIELSTTIGVAFVCGQYSSNSLAVLPSNGTLPTRSTWMDAPEPNDAVHVAVYEAGTVNSRRFSGTISGIASSDTVCASSALKSGMVGKATKIELQQSVVGHVIIGAPLIVTRRARLSLYKAGDNKWYIGMRYLRASGWEGTQPIAGPFESSTQEGMRIQVIARNGAVLPARVVEMPVDTLTQNAPVLVAVTLRATADWKNTDGRSDSDSLLFSVALRNR